MLEDAGIKLSSVATDVMGASGKAMLQARVAGTTDPDTLAELAQGKLRRKLPALREALAGRFRPAHAFLLGHILAKLDFLEETLAAISAQIAVVLTSFDSAMTRLMTIPGVKRRTADTIIAETDGDMTRFATDAQLCSWTGICPGQDESAASRAAGTALQARYQRVKLHRGHKKAVVATRHDLLVIAYHILAKAMTYQELGADYFDARHRDRAIRRHIKQLEQLGYKVSLEEPAA